MYMIWSRMKITTTYLIWLENDTSRNRYISVILWRYAPEVIYFGHMSICKMNKVLRNQT